MAFFFYVHGDVTSRRGLMLGTQSRIDERDCIAHSRWPVLCIGYVQDKKRPKATPRVVKDDPARRRSFEGGAETITTDVSCLVLLGDHPFSGVVLLLFTRGKTRYIICEDDGYRPMDTMALMTLPTFHQTLIQTHGADAIKRNTPDIVRIVLQMKETLRHCGMIEKVLVTPAPGLFHANYEEG
ncbi:hypothetical protein F4677DRAFT_78211 [Hypoxylon crocopeplum]|nr:hypothetical protein F4677DRAFT_78211 [Hypoxylon crocopeplum]